jgi:hypothetical protein
MKTTITRDGWTVEASTEGLRPEIRLRGEDWGANQDSILTPGGIAMQLRVARKAAEIGAGTGGWGSQYTIPAPDVPMVLDMIDEVLPSWLEATTASHWRRLAQGEAMLTTAFLFQQFGVSTDKLYPQTDDYDY